MAAGGDRLEVKLSGGYGFPQLERLIRDLHPINSLSGEPRVLDLNLRGLVFMGPASLALFVATLKRVSENRLIRAGSIIRMPNSPLTFNYLHRMDVLSHLEGARSDEPFDRKPPVGFRPCARFQNAVEHAEVAADLTDALGERCDTDAISLASIRICLDELTENVIHHADSALGGFAVAQGWKKNKQFEIGIADLGVGIRASLAKNPKYSHVTTDTEAVQTALGPHVTSTPERNAGIGLFITKLLLAANGGTLLVRSGNGAVRSETSEEAVETAVALPGTLVALRARTDRPLNIKDVYRQLETLTDDAQDDGSTG